jgi:hypothetical protein
LRVSLVDDTYMNSMPGANRLMSRCYSSLLRVYHWRDEFCSLQRASLHLAGRRLC